MLTEAQGAAQPAYTGNDQHLRGIEEIEDLKRDFHAALIS